jgi:4-amino-4-deoxy-L-arabinose transferase-like glycosyltransferase
VDVNLLARVKALPERWLVPGLLAVPFLVMIVVLRGMTVTLPIFHGSDELVYQLPTIRQFARELPFPDLHAYPAAQTPLFHLLLAYAGKIIGYSLWALRLVEVALSYLLVLAVYALLRRRLRLPTEQAFALTMLFELSPYIFGQSFRVVTDNFATLWVIIAIDWLERYRTSGRVSALLVASIAVSAGILTRQSTAFLVAMVAIYVVYPRVPGTHRQRLTGLVVLGIALVPPLLLFANWHGLIPAGSFPGSCGLCSQGPGSHGVSATGLEPQTTELALATIGIYGLVLFAPTWLDVLRARWRAAPSPRELSIPVGCALLGAVLLIAFPARPGTRGAGDLWAVAGHLPIIDGSSLLFWVFVPVAGAVLCDRLRRAPNRLPAAAFALTFLLSTLLIRNAWQKYVDPFSLLILCMTAVPNELRGRRLAGVLVLSLAFIVYAADYSSHDGTTASASAAHVGSSATASVDSRAPRFSGSG